MPASAREPLVKVAVVGDGPVGLAAAIALRRALPCCAVVVIPTPPDPAALADRSATLAPRSNAFLQRIGVEEGPLAVRAGACPKLGVDLVGWAGAGTEAVHPYGAGPMDDIDAAPVSTVLARAGRFAQPSDDPESPLSDIDYALRFSPPAFTRHLAALATHLGVVRGPAGFAGAGSDGAGGIAQIKLADGAEVAADLFIDCSGPSALVASGLPAEPHLDWSRILPCDRLLIPPLGSTLSLTPLDRVTTAPLGWRAEVFGRDGTHAVFATNAACASLDEIASAAGLDEAQVVTLVPGRRGRLWQANVVCIGDSGVQFEPLLWLNASLAHAQIELLLELLPGRDLHPLERDEFNRRAAGMADRVRDFIALHYCGPRHPEGPFWSHAAQSSLPDSLRLTIDEFTRRGRLPFFEEDILPREAWVSAMASIGLKRGPTARSMTLSPATRAALVRHQEERSKGAVQQAVPYRDWLAAYLQRAQ